MSGKKKEEEDHHPLHPPSHSPEPSSFASPAKHGAWSRQERSGVLYPTLNVRSVPHAITHTHAVEVGSEREIETSGELVETGRPRYKVDWRWIGGGVEWIISPP